MNDVFPPFSSKKKWEGEESGRQSRECFPSFFVGEKKEEGEVVVWRAFAPLKRLSI